MNRNDFFPFLLSNENPFFPNKTDFFTPKPVFLGAKKKKTPLVFANRQPVFLQAKPDFSNHKPFFFSTKHGFFTYYKQVFPTKNQSSPIIDRFLLIINGSLTKNGFILEYQFGGFFFFNLGFLTDHKPILYNHKPGFFFRS